MAPRRIYPAPGAGIIALRPHGLTPIPAAGGFSRLSNKGR